MDNTESNWETQLRKGMLRLAVLAALAEERRYGYALTQRLETALGLRVGEGTVYPLLNRLKGEGLVQATLEPSPRGPARKYYELTDEGRAALKWMRRRWALIVEGMDTMMEGGNG